MLPATEPAQKPNVIIIFVDDQGYQDLGVYGSPNIKTPHLDKMAKEGMRFTNFYTASPVCTPSRAALLTGCYPQRVGDLNVLFPDDSEGLSSKETTIAEMLRSNGYATACIGKWHLGHHQKFLPTQHGFDSYFGIPYSNDMSIAKDMKLAAELNLRVDVTLDSMWKSKKNWVPLMRNEEVVEYPADQNTLTKRYTEEALQFINDNHDRPFFLYLPHTMPHIPLYASADFEGTSEAGLYGDCIEEIDWSVGQIMQTLKRLKLEQNTIVFYTSDNGPWDLKGNATDKVKGNKNRRIGGSALPLRGFKFQAWEGGMRVPAVAWWPGQIPANTTCDEVASTIDILPTLAQLSQGTILPELEIDGKSIAPLLLDQDGASSPHAAYFYRDEAVRVGHWKGVIHPKSKDFELYDLDKDIAESNNLASEHPERAESMLLLLKAHCKKMELSKRPCGEVEVRK
ncbi:MAG: sulfatase [Planctomycetes bacterium]|nr:sulfatase [Planctomycetota bacterium]